VFAMILKYAVQCCLFEGGINLVDYGRRDIRREDSGEMEDGGTGGANELGAQ